MEEFFNKVIDILYAAKQNDVEIILNGDRLQLKVPEDQEIDEQLLNDIRANKQLIIDFLSNESWKSKSINDTDKIAVFDRATPIDLPLSFAQERLWFIDRLEGSVQYHVPAVFRLKGEVNKAALAKTFQTIVNRHEVLRTVMTEKGGRGYQEIKAENNWTIEELQVADQSEAELRETIQSLINKPFTLTEDHMLRAALLEISETEHILVVTMHHIASDAWSMPVVVGEVAALYKEYTTGEQANLPELPVQYADYALWQRGYLKEELLEEKLNYWKEKLDDVAPLQLPADYTRPAVQGTKGSTLLFSMDTEIGKGLQTLSREQGVTLYMTLLSVFKVLLYRYSGQEDICVGTSIAGRPRQELEGLIGFFVNTLALRDEVKGEESFTDLLKKVKQTTLGAYEHQDVPFEKVVETVVKERDKSRSPLFQVMLVLGNTPEVPEVKLGGLELSGYSYEQTTVKFDLTFFVTETKDGLRFAVQYNTDVYEHVRIARMTEHFQQLIRSVLANPQGTVGHLQILTAAEEANLLNQGKSTVAYPETATVVSLFEAQAAKTPDAKALVFEDKSLTYAELNQKANQLAHYLQRHGVKAGTLVPLYMDRGIGQLTGMLGILKAGGAYVPLDTDMPQERIGHLLEDTDAKIAISESKYAERLTDENDNLKVAELDELDWELSLESESNPAITHNAYDIAYVIYTSGSTGKPKGVKVSHRNLVDYVYGLDEKIQISRCRRFAMVTTIATDLGNTVLYSSLLYGGELHVISKAMASHIEAMQEYVEDNRIDCIKIVPSHWKALSPEPGAPLLPSKLLIFGGEALPKSSVERIRLYGDCRVVNHYGPTETTIGKLLYEIPAEEEITGNIIPIGKSFSNTEVYILSKEGEVCPVGVPGQLLIGGAGVAGGYLNREELTAEKFIDNPFGTNKLYQTGDKVRYNAEGYIEYLGRIDDQVKIRGYRVEPGEISRVLETSDKVKQAVVISREDRQGNLQLAGYVVAEGKFDRGAILDYLKAQLPDYMVPAYLQEIEKIPLTANGKVDRKALPDPEGEQIQGGHQAPKNETEEILAEIWADILELDTVGTTDNFFELGGHSLLAVRLISAVRRAFKAELPISDVFDYPTIAELSERLQGDQTENKEEAAAPAVLLPQIKVSERPDEIPLSFSQERLWFIDRLEGSVQYHVPAVLRLKGTLNISALENTFKGIVNRHEVLRTVIKEHNGTGYQQVKAKDNWNLSQQDLTNHTEEQVKQAIQTLISLPFDLAEDTLLRATLLTLSAAEYILVVTMHHIASDGWSGSILVKEFIELYRSEVTQTAPNLQTLPVQYADYALWQRNYLQGETLNEKLNYWKTKLDDVAPLQLPTDYARPSVQGTQGSTTTFQLPDHLSKALHQISKEQGVTLYMTVLAVLKVLLYRYSGQEDICVGSPVAGRNQSELEGLIGFFVNTLALRNEVKGEETFNQLLSKVKQTTLEAYAHQDVPFEKVVETVVKERDLSRSPLFQVMLVLQNTPEIPKLQLNDLELDYLPEAHGTSKFDITMFLTEHNGGIRGAVEYNTALYNEATIARLISHYEELIAAISSNPTEKIGQLNILTNTEKEQQLNQFNNTKTVYPTDKNLAQLFEAQAEKTPSATALVFEGKELTYDTLNKQANQLANLLKKQGVKAETLVPLCIERSTEMIIAILAILKAGGAYVPIDPEYPQDRIAYMLEDTNAALIITSTTGKEKLSDYTGKVIELGSEAIQAQLNNESEANVFTETAPDNLAYVIYTSGSTGKPKGVMMPGSNLVNLLFWQEDQFKNKARRVLQFAAFTFDVSFQEIFSTLCFGGTLYLINGERRRDVNELMRDVDRYKITHLFFPFIVLQNLAEFIVSLPEGTHFAEEVIIAGEQLKITDDIAKLVHKTGTRIINQYGPTEAHVVSWFDVDNAALPPLPPIGRPICNTQIYIMNEAMALAPVGVYGELCIGGVQVARGYLNRPELTAEKFISDPFSGDASAKLYRTGDLCRWMPDGNIEYIGRRDDQVKIRGFRVEPGEIESVVQQSGLVRQTVIIAAADAHGNKRLIGYVVPDEGYTKEKLVAYLNGVLPDYMVPQLWVEETAFKVTLNGKVDKRALKAPDMSEIQSAKYQAPENETEAILAKIWGELLGLDKVSTNDNFFELGGHSLLAMRVIAQIRVQTGKELSVRELFTHPTVGELSAHLLAGEHTAAVLPKIIPAVRPDQIPLSFSQERLWFIDQLEGSTQYHVPAVFSLKGELNKLALQRTFRAIIDRHEVLRTVIVEKDGYSYQQINHENDWALGYTNVTGNSEAVLKQHIQTLVSRPFNLGADSMLRADLLELDANDHVLVVTMHHIASDGWSGSVMAKEFVALYQNEVKGTAADLPELPVQYADYALWQHGYLQGETLDKKLNYWKEKLDDVAPLQLPTDYARPAIQGTNGSTTTFKLDAQISKAVQELSREQGVTLYMTLLSVFKVLLYRYSGQEDVCVGTSIAGRSQQELDNLIGFFVNTLALRDEVKGDHSFVELLNAVKQTTLEAYEHQDVPFEKVVESVVKERDQSRSPLFQAMLVLQNTPEVPELKLGGLNLSTYEFELTTVKFELTFVVTELVDGLQFAVQYNTDLYHEDTIARMIGNYKELINSVLLNREEKIGRLRLLTDAEINQQLIDFNDTAVEYPADKSIAEIFEEQAAQTPDAVALVFEGEEVTYSALNARANRLARYLQKQGVKAETMVPICAERGLEMIIGTLAILKAGGAYVPIDAEYPEERINYMLEDINTEILLSSAQSRDKLPAFKGKVIELGANHIFETESDENLTVTVSASNLAYVIYTSGSTGKPKGVLVEQRNVVSLVKNVNYINIGSDDILLITASPTFDAATFEFWGFLLNGAKLIIVKNDELFDIAKLKKYLIEFKVNIMWFTSGLFNQLSEDHPEIFVGLDAVLFGGEKISERLALKVKHVSPAIKLIHCYGPTENTTYSLTYLIQGNESLIPIGKPFSNRTAYILNDYQQLTPIGAIGEIYVGGAGVSRGYLNRPELTAEKFIDNPFDTTEGSKLYRTGDLCRWWPDGNIDYVGRKDDQVKIRGFRIEPGEIESAVHQSGLVKQTVVIAAADMQGSKRLIGYVIPDEGYTKEKLVAYLNRVLPDYMVPQIWVEEESFKLNNSGKVDKRALKAPDMGAVYTNEYKAPENETEEMLAAIWSVLLGIEKVGTTDNFFELGGHSLLAMRAISQIRQQTGQELTVRELFSHPTIAELSNHLLLNIDATAALPEIIVGERPNEIPLSFSQERLWFIDKMEGSVQYHIPAVFRLKGTLNKAALRNTFQAIVNRHEALRTIIIEENGRGYQQVKAKNDWTLGYQNLAGKTEAEIKEYIQVSISQPFDLTTDAMLRAELLAITENDHVLVITMHHIASDGWSGSVLVKEFVELYRSEVTQTLAELPTLPIQYADYALWQRGYLQGEVLSNKLSYWKEKLGDVSPLQLPADHARPAVQGTNGKTKMFQLPTPLSKGISELSKQQGVSLYMAALAAFKVLLYRYSGQEDICVGSPVAGRNQNELEGLIGFFVNTLALRDEVKGDEPFTELLHKVKQTTLAAYEHQDVPFEKVVETVVKERDLSRSPLFQVMLVLQNTPDVPELKLDELELEYLPEAHGTSKFDITMFLTERNGEIHGGVEYNTDLYEAATIDRLISHYEHLIAAIIANPAELVGKLNLLSEAEKTQQLNEFNDNQLDYPKDKVVTQLFEQQVKQNPDAIAVVFGEQTLTYDELNKKANQLARYLKKQGVQAETLVPLCIERGPEMLISILAILKASGAYVPIDPEYPQDRISYMLQDTQAGFVISSAASSDKLGAFGGTIIDISNTAIEAELQAENDTDLAATASPDSLAYVIYTSGSTGKPKGVMVEHRNTASFINWSIQEFANSDFDIVYASTSMCFDLSVFEMFYPLSTGKKLRILKNGLDIKNYLNVDEAILINTVPSVIESLLKDKADLHHVNIINMAGEPVPVHVLEGLDTTAIEVRNLYGPTEDTTYSTQYVMRNGEPVLIGKPIANTNIYICNKVEEGINPLGITGEIFIGGAGIARGYLNRPELTAERFISDPFSKNADAKLYRTGDLGRWLPDGNIEYLGRKDDQVKIRGYRIELGEIEQVLMQSGLVQQAVVLARPDKQGAKRLIGYVTTNTAFNRDQIVQYLQAYLPDYMVPGIWLKLEEFPLTSNGKLDKRALPDPDFTEIISHTYAAPRNEVEEKLCNIWGDLLSVPHVGIYDNFFELGGDSILTIQIVSQARRVGLRLQPKDIFYHQMIASLAEVIIQRGDDVLLGEQGVLTGNAGLLPIQQWYLQKNQPEISYYNQAVFFKLNKNISSGMLQSALSLITMQHDALRFVYTKEGAEWEQRYGNEHAQLLVEDLQDEEKNHLPELITASAKKHQQSLSITEGKLMRAVLMQMPGYENDNRLLIVVHHLAIDGVSWRIILEDLNQLLDSMIGLQQPSMGAKTSSYRQWHTALTEYGLSKKIEAQKAYWNGVANSFEPLPDDWAFNGDVMMSDVAASRVKLDAINTMHLLQEVPKVYHTEINDILLAALSKTLCDWAGQQKVIIGLEGHGREAISESIDSSRTVGWFTSLYPVMLAAENDTDGLIKGVKEELRRIPEKGLGFGVLKYINKIDALQSRDPWDIVFNYLGQLDKAVSAGNWLSRADEEIGQSVSAANYSDAKLSVNCFIVQGELVMNWGYSTKHYRAETIKTLGETYIKNLATIISYCMEKGKLGKVYTPADFGLSAEIKHEELDKFLEDDNSDNIMSF
ncbi:hypothetical protein GCM10023149_13950 [Mucilaginibacter gynuensis]|uniref:Carrier domain-containing protein n=1 Tax=Mucilaginibacter gynuensis TaxID=1302236 RepID=A0ABP8G499_9SPHI